MPKPAILAVDDDAAVAAAVVRDLRGRYGADYRIVRASSGEAIGKHHSSNSLTDTRPGMRPRPQRMEMSMPSWSRSV